MEKFIQIVKPIAVVIAILMSAYHLYAGAFGAPEAMMHRSVHLIFTLLLIFLLGMASERITIYQNADGDIRWLVAGGTLILMAFYPAWLILSSFVSKDHFKRLINLEIVIMVSGSQLLVIFIGFGVIYLATIPFIKEILQTLGVNYPNPFLYFIILKGVGCFLYYCFFHLIPDFEKKRFSLFISPLERPEKLRYKIVSLLKSFMRKSYFFWILTFYIIFIIWGVILGEYFQIFIILIIGILTLYFIYMHKRYQ